MKTIFWNFLLGQFRKFSRRIVKQDPIVANVFSIIFVVRSEKEEVREGDIEMEKEIY